MLSPTTCAGACPEFRLPDTLVGCAPSLLIQWCNVLMQTEGVGMDLCSRNRIGHVLKHCRVAKKELRASLRVFICYDLSFVQRILLVMEWDLPCLAAAPLVLSIARGAVELEVRGFLLWHVWHLFTTVVWNNTKWLSKLLCSMKLGGLNMNKE